MGRAATKPDPVALFARILPLDPRIERRQMFGCPCAFANGIMFMGVHQGSLFLRLGEADRAHVVTTHGARLFDPMGGRPMREYVVVPETILADAPVLADWVARSMAYALTVVRSPKRSTKQPNATPK